MKQIKISALVLAAASIASTGAMAQSSKTNAWEGADVAISVGYAQFMPKIGTGSTSPLTIPVLVAPPSTYVNTNVGSAVASASASNVNTGTANISAGYNFGINSDYVLGIRAAYYPGASSSASGSFAITAPGGGSPIPIPAGTPLGSPASVQYNVKNLYAITLTPGYVIDKDRLAYLKVGYTGTSIGLNGPTLAYSTVNLSGYTLGLGYKQMVSESIYLLGEFNYGGFSNKTATVTNTSGVAITAPFGGSGIDFLVGVGYRF